MRTPTLRVLALCVALSATGLACSSKGGSDASSDTTAKTTTTAKAKSTTTTEATTTTTTEATTTTLSADGEKIVAFVEPLLLTVEDLGEPSFAVTDPGAPTPAPCGFDLDADYPNDAKVGVLLASQKLSLGLKQDVRVYSSIEKAAAAYQAVLTEGLGCAKTPDGSATISPAEDVSTDVTPAGAELNASAFAVKGSQNESSVIVVHFSDTVVVFQFAGAIGAAEKASAPNPVDIAKFGMEKLVKGLPQN